MLSKSDVEIRMVGNDLREFSLMVGDTVVAVVTPVNSEPTGFVVFKGSVPESVDWDDPMSHESVSEYVVIGVDAPTADSAYVLATVLAYELATRHLREIFLG